MRRAVFGISGVILSGLYLCGMGYSARIAIADRLSRENTLSGARGALNVLSDNAEYWKDLAVFEPEKASQFVRFLTQRGHGSDATLVLKRLANCSGEGVDRTLLSYTSHLLLGGQTNEAMAVWHDLSLKGRIPYAALAPEQGRSLTNGYF